LINDRAAADLSTTQGGAAPLLFDVFVRMPAHVDLDLVLHMATEKTGLPVRQLELLLDMLKCVPSVRIAASVPDARAEQLDQAFTEAGLMVKRVRVEPVAPVLTLAPLSDTAPDGKRVCPACGERVALTEDRRCPACDVYVDRVDPERLLRKRLREQEAQRQSGKKSRSANESGFDSRMDSRQDSRLDSRLDSRQDSRLDSRLDRPSRTASSAGAKRGQRSGVRAGRRPAWQWVTGLVTLSLLVSSLVWWVRPGWVG